MSGNKRNALGRGLGALLQDANESEKTAKYSINTIADILISKIETNPFQPRTDFDQDALLELSESIKVHGIIQPITVRQLESGTFQLISGERRFQASKLAGLDKIPAYIRKANDQQMLEMGLVENIQRENLNSIEIALSYQRLIHECNLKQEELGERVGKNRSTVTNYLRLLKLPPTIQAGLRDNNISMGHARAIINIENIEYQLAVFNKIISDGLSVRQTEELAKNQTNTKKQSSKKEPKSNDDVIKKLNNELSSYFGTKVEISHSSSGKGQIKIPYLSSEDLNRILEILNITI